MELMDKKAVRSRMKAARSAITIQQVLTASASITRHIVACDAYRKAKRIMGYLAFSREASVDGVLAAALADGKEVYVPYITSATEFVAARIYNMKDFTLDRYGIRSVAQPVAAIEPDKLDLILVPGVAFDKQGNRMGMGAGYYDRFLPQTGRAVTIGVTYDALVTDKLITDEYDVQMQLLATESGIKSCSGR